ncbi:hypothetical protein FE257_011301 [Aspergillus nanangensis]|uniref:Uncharacterized protein n=1 Tax=Aspergillus nanangensis TaxID=2582783 RepID=A0AAD4CHE9_ASPNN|nr:hypothetical protein FE257_011301 [Aspergillus nanangensis]
MQTRHHHHDVPSQPPKQAAYDQANNPVTHTPREQRLPPHQERIYGNHIDAINRRAASSKPSSDEAIAHLMAEHREEERQMQNEPDVDLEYGVEQQPNEGEIAYAVEHRSEEARQRAEVGAHAGPGHPTYHPGGEERDYAADMARKKKDHDRVLGERVGHNPPEPDAETVERELLWERRVKEQRDFHPGEIIHEATGEPVVEL